MPRRSGRSAEETREMILRAGGELLGEQVATGASVISLPVSQVLERANQIIAQSSPDAPPFTTGAVAHAFGGRDGLTEQVLRHFLGPGAAGSALREEMERSDRHESADKALDALSDADVINMVETNSEHTRVWLLALASTKNANLADVTAQVYREFDEVLIPEYRRLAQEAGRKLRPGYSWEDLAAAFTLAAEGAAIRHLGDPAARDRLLRVAREVRRAAWERMTEPEE